jgi:hypothetical protein
MDVVVVVAVVVVDEDAEISGLVSAGFVLGAVTVGLTGRLAAAVIEAEGNVGFGWATTETVDMILFTTFAAPERMSPKRLDCAALAVGNQGVRHVSFVFSVDSYQVQTREIFSELQTYQLR